MQSLQEVALPEGVLPAWCSQAGWKEGLPQRPLGVRMNGMLGFEGVERLPRGSELCFSTLTFFSGQVSVLSFPG